MAKTGLSLQTVHRAIGVRIRYQNEGVSGGTRPLAAILAGLELRPERMIVMSDGQFDGSIVGTITKANPGKKTKIDCIGMDEEIETLQRIADENGGHYSQVASLPGKR